MGMSNAAASAMVATYLLGGGLGGLLGGWIGDKAAARWPDHGRITATQFSVIVGVPFALLLFKVRLGGFWWLQPAGWRDGSAIQMAECAAPAAALRPARPSMPPSFSAPTGPVHGRRARHGGAVRRRHRGLGAAHRLARALLQQPCVCRDRAPRAAQPHLCI